MPSTCPQLAPGGVLMIDDGLVALPADHRQDITTFGLAATHIAEQLGTNRAANSVMLGFWTAIAGVVSREAMRHSVAESVPAKTMDLNLKAFDTGYEEGKRQLAESPDGDLRKSGEHQA